LKYDILIKNGRIIDGSGNPWYNADIGIIEDKIDTIDDIDGRAEKIIDANRMVVAPGFIDIHSHSDIPILVDYHAHSKIRQGVTTEVIGNCGNSAAPMNEFVKEYRDRFAKSRVPDDFQYDWETMKDYIERVEMQGTSLNIAPMVGHGTIRMNVVGYENRSPTDSEMQEMKNLIKQSIKEGAWGMSTGLIYPPSVYAETKEIVELTKTVAEQGGIYFSHIRGEGETLLDAVIEACEIGLQSNTPVQIAHFKSSGKPNWGKIKIAHEILERYREKGVDVTFDQYPYIASSTNLTALFPHWTQEGGAEKLLERLKDHETRARIREELGLNYGWDNILVTSAKNNPEYDGKNLKEIGEVMGKDPFNAVCDLLIMEDAQVPSVMFGMNEDDVEWAMKSPIGMIGSDGSAISPEGILGKGKPHPRLYGTFPRVLGYYVREKNVISLQEAVRKMTSAPSLRMGFKDRGLLRERLKADITIFDPQEIKDNATFIDPHQYPRGIGYVIVNGIVVIEKGNHKGNKPGKVLRSH